MIWKQTPGASNASKARNFSLSTQERRATEIRHSFPWGRGLGKRDFIGMDTPTTPLRAKGGIAILLQQAKKRLSSCAISKGKIHTSLTKDPFPEAASTRSTNSSWRPAERRKTPKSPPSLKNRSA